MIFIRNIPTFSICIIGIAFFLVFLHYYTSKTFTCFLVFSLGDIPYKLGQPKIIHKSTRFVKLFSQLFGETALHCQQGVPIETSSMAWSQCMDSQLGSYSPNQWDALDNIVTTCIKKLQLNDPVPFVNKDETKYAYLANPEKESVLLTIGVGKDILSEEEFRISQPKTKFYGADPITTFNEDLYNTLGNFFPFAIGRDTKKSVASVLIDGKYVERQLFHLNIIVFIKYLVKHHFIDHLWLDAEGAEYGIHSMSYKNGDFDKANINICQVNIETHTANSEDKAKFMKFVKKIVEEGKYVIVRSFHGPLNNRLFIVNVANQSCKDKFNI